MNFKETNLTELANYIHAFNVEKGWWDEYLDDKHRRFKTAMMLTISELAEAMEGERKDLVDQHLPHLDNFSVELADSLIRLLDLAGAYEYDINYVKVNMYGSRPEMLFMAVQDMMVDHESVQAGINAVLSIAHKEGIDILAIAQEKFEYNKIRLDHLRENREKVGGKKF